MNRSVFFLCSTLWLGGCAEFPSPLDVGDAEETDGLVADSGPLDGPVSDGPPRDIDASPPPIQPCRWVTECPDGDCIDGVCRVEEAQRCFQDADCPPGESCGGVATLDRCATPCELAGDCPLRTRSCNSVAGCPVSQHCETNRCVTSCVTDAECGDGHCMDGVCGPFPLLFDGDPAPAMGLPGQLYAGAAVLPFDFPVGVSSAGYGGRRGAQTPYNFSLGGSDRVFERQDVRVIVLSDEDDLVIVLRMPLSWSTDYLRVRTALELQRLTVDAQHPKGIDYLDHIVTTATHSHSQPGRFWHLLRDADLGTLGFGTFSGEMVDRYAKRFAEAIKIALDDARPARFGFTVVDDFDPHGQIHTDRRVESPQFLDDRMMVWRVEDLEGTPIAGLVNFGMHGTHLETTTITGDAAAGVEVVVTAQLSAKVDSPVPVMFVNGNGGNVSPRGDDIVSQPFAKIQMVGHHLWPRFEAAWDAIEPVPDVPLELVTQRIPVDYHRLGYDETVPEFRDEFGNPYLNGGFYCVAEGHAPDDPPYVDGALGCAIDPRIFNGAPVPNAHKTVLSVFRLGELVVTTLPGEPTSELGMLLAGWVEMDAMDMGHDTLRAVNFGYSQDHQLYLLTQDDWLQGGYEASNNWFGWRLGEYLAQESRRLARQLLTPEREPIEHEVRPMWWPDVDFTRVQPTQTPGGAGRLAAELVSTVSRGGVFEVRWIGGHPGVDLPRVRLERSWGGGRFTPAHRSGGLPFDDSGFDSMLRYHGDYEADHTWSIRWEVPFEFVAEDLRLTIEGRHWTPAGTVDYTLATPSIALHPANLSIHHVEVGDDAVSFDVNYPDTPSNDDGQSPFEALQPQGHLVRFRPTPEMGRETRQWAIFLGPPLFDESPLSVTVEGGEGSWSVSPTPNLAGRALVVSRGEDGTERVVQIARWPSHRVSVPGPIPDVPRLIVTDRYGNRGVVNLEGQR